MGSYKVVRKTIASSEICWYNCQRWRKNNKPRLMPIGIAFAIVLFLRMAVRILEFKEGFLWQ